MLINLTEVDHETQDEKCDCCIDRRFAQNIAGLSAEGSLSHPATHCGAHSTVRLRLLGQHDEDQKQGNKDQYKRRDADENAHVKGLQSRATPAMSIAEACCLEAPAKWDFSAYFPRSFPPCLQVPSVLWFNAIAGHGKRT